MAISKDEGFRCAKCKKFHKFPAYVYAHWTDILIHTCDSCGNRARIESGVVTSDHVEPPPAPVDPRELPQGAEIELTKIGSINNGIDGSDEYQLLTRKDDDITLEQAHEYIKKRYYCEAKRPGGYFCTSFSVVFAQYSTNQVICTLHHRFDV